MFNTKMNYKTKTILKYFKEKKPVKEIEIFHFMRH